MSNDFPEAPGTYPTDDFAMPLQEVLASSKETEIRPLTAEQQAWLNNYLPKKCSTKKQVENLLVAVGHKEAYVREAALKTIRELLLGNPALATPSCFRYRKKAA